MSQESSAPIPIARDLLRQILNDAVMARDPSSLHDCESGSCFLNDHTDEEVFEAYQELYEMIWPTIELQNVSDDSLNLGKMNQAARGIAQHLTSELQNLCRTQHQDLGVKDPQKLEREVWLELKKLVDDEVGADS